MKATKIIAVISAFLAIQVSGGPLQEEELRAAKETVKAGSTDPEISKSKSSKELAAFLGRQKYPTYDSGRWECPNTNYWEDKYCANGHRYGCYQNSCYRTCDLSHDDGCEMDYEYAGAHWCYVYLGYCVADKGCKNAAYAKCSGAEKSPFQLGDSGTPCPHDFDGYYCDLSVKRSFGCADNSHCWRSVGMCRCVDNLGGMDGYGKCKENTWSTWCYVDAGGCTYDSNCLIATTLPCHISHHHDEADKCYDLGEFADLKNVPLANKKRQALELGHASKVGLALKLGQL